MSFEDYLKDILDGYIDSMGVTGDDDDYTIDLTDGMTLWRWDILGDGSGSDIYWQDTSEFLENATSWMEGLDTTTLAALQVAYTTMDDDFKTDYGFEQDEDGYNNFMMFMFASYQDVAEQGLIDVNLSDGGDWYEKPDYDDAVWTAMDSLTDTQKEVLN